jgi:hypothetical protein
MNVNVGVVLGSKHTGLISKFCRKVVERESLPSAGRGRLAGFQEEFPRPTGLWIYRTRQDDDGG